ncbi:MAG: tail fiber domain-containing protein [Candidatus Paceibacterota bacterium]|nr:MAG: tail fiber domain-containing protein [Candidatus Paceibacterota bacterium]
MQKINFKIIALGLIVGLAGIVGVNYVLAQWSAPDEAPPEGNVFVPVNVGDKPQDKNGVFRANGLRSFVDLYVDEKVGIGTTNPNTKLHIVGNDGVQIQRANNSGFANVYFRTGTDDNTRSSIGFIPAGGANDLVFRVGNLVERMRITSAGNVGIGTTNPGARLEVNGQVKITGGSPGAGRVLTSDAAGLASWATPSGGLPGGSSNQTLRHDGSGWIASNNIKNNGTNVNIGPDGLTSDRLRVQGHLNISGNGILKTNGNSGTTGQVLTRTDSGMAWETPVGGGGSNFWTQSGNLLFPNNTAWNVGLGINTPSSKLHIKDSENILTRIDSANANQQAAISFDDRGSSKFIIGKQTNNGFFMWNNKGGNQGSFDFLTSSPTGPLSLRSQGLLSLNANLSDAGLPGIISFRTQDVARMAIGVGGGLAIGPNPDSVDTTGRRLFVYGSGNTVFRHVAGDSTGETSIDLVTTGQGGGSGHNLSKNWSIISRGNSYIPAGERNDLLFSFYDGPAGGQWTEGMRLKRNGDLHDLRVTGDVYAKNFNQSSDANLKTNIQNLSDSLAKIIELRGVTFNWKNRVDEKENIGFIAQEIEKIFPELVHGEDGQKSVNYVSLVPVLVEAVKELDEKNKELEARLEKLEKRLGISF